MKYLSRFDHFYRNLFALGTAASYQTLMQMVAIPIFLAALQVERYSEWLIAFSIAQFTGLLDFGSITSTQNSFKLLTVRGLDDLVNQRIKQISNFLTISFFGFIFILFYLHENSRTTFNINLTIIFVVSNLLQSYFGILEGLTRIDSKTSFGIYASTALRFTEFIGTLLGLLLYPKSLILVGLTGLILKTLFFTFILYRFHNQYQFMQFGRPNISIIIQNIKEGGAFLIIKSSEWILISCTVLVLSKKISATELVLFISSRTFFRLGIQITMLISTTYGYEMTNTWASNDYLTMLQLIKRSSRVTIMLATFGLLIYGTIGKNIYALWMHSQLALHNSLLIWGALYSLVLSISQNQKTKFNSINFNFHISVIQLLCSLLTVGFLYLANSGMTLEYIYAVLTIAEVFSFTLIRLFTRNRIENYFYENR